jgi:nuclease HARBI1
MYRLAAALNFPEVWQTDNRLKLKGIDAFAIILARLSYPNRLFDLERTFGRTYDQISRISGEVIDAIYYQWKHLLDFNSQRLTPQYLELLAEASISAGSMLLNCWGYIDGTLRPISRPTKNQKFVYSGHKRRHGIKFQSVVTPDGIISHLSGPYLGKEHDATILRRSGLVETMLEKAKDTYGNQMVIYGDQAYGLAPYLARPFGGAYVSAEKQAFNHLHSKLRICVEWMFGEILGHFAFLDFNKNLKLGLQPVAKYYIVGALLTNCHTCIYGNQKMENLFKISSPSLEEYLVDRN